MGDLEERKSGNMESPSSSLQEEVNILRERLRVVEEENVKLQVNHENTTAAIPSCTDPALPYSSPVPSPRSPLVSIPPLSSTSSSLSLLETSAATSLLEKSLEEAEERIAGLLAVRDRLVIVQEEKSRLQSDVSSLEDELETLAAASRSLTACTVLPILVLIIAIVTAFLPFVSRLVGTSDF